MAGRGALLRFALTPYAAFLTTFATDRQTRRRQFERQRPVETGVPSALAASEMTSCAGMA